MTVKRYMYPKGHFAVQLPPSHLVDFISDKNT